MKILLLLILFIIFLNQITYHESYAPVPTQSCLDCIRNRCGTNSVYWGANCNQIPYTLSKCAISCNQVCPLSDNDPLAVHNLP